KLLFHKPTLLPGSAFLTISVFAAEESEDFRRDLFSFHRHFAEPPGPVVPFRFRQGRAADNYARVVLRRFGQRFEARGEVYPIADNSVVKPLSRAHVAGDNNRG